MQHPLNKSFDKAGYASIEVADEERTIKHAIPVFKPFKWSNLMFSWYEPQIKLGSARPLSKDDLMPLPVFLTSKEVFETFKQIYNFESLRLATKHSGFSKTTGSAPPRPKLWRVLHSLVFTEFWLSGLCRLANDLLVVLGTVLIKFIVSAAERRDARSAFMCALLMTASSLAQAFMLQQFIHGSFMSGSRVVCAATSAVFHASQALRLHKMVPPKSIGEINNVQSKDTSALRDLVVFSHNLWACPLQVVVIVALLVRLLGGVAGVVSVAALAALVPVERAVGRRARAARKEAAQHADKRMALVHELIDGIQTVKLTNLCPYMYERVTKLRDQVIVFERDARCSPTTNLLLLLFIENIKI